MHRSKKHLEQVAEMRELLEADDALAVDAGSHEEAPAAGQSSVTRGQADSAEVEDSAAQDDAGTADPSQPDDDSDSVPALIGRSRKQQAKKLRKQQAKRAALFDRSPAGDSHAAVGLDPTANGASASRDRQPPATADSHASGSDSDAAPSVDGSDVEPAPPPMRSLKQRRKKQRKQQANQAALQRDTESDGSADEDEDAMLAAMMRRHTVRQQESAAPAVSSSDDETSGQDHGDPAEGVSSDLRASSGSLNDTPPAQPPAGSGSDDEECPGHAHRGPTTDSVPAKKPKRRKGKSKAGVAPAPIDAPIPANALECGVCHDLFGSRTALFRHIKEAGHAVVKR